MGAGPILCLLLLGAVSTLSEFTLGIDGTNAKIEVSAYAHGILRYRIREEGKYEVQDVVIPTPIDVGVSGSGGSAVLSSGPSSLHLSEGLKAEFTNGKTVISLSVSPRNEGQPDEVSATITFPLATTVYGIPERAIDLTLKDGHKYRLFNLDIFKYAIDNDQGLYGTIPFLMAHSKDVTSGMLWLNAADTSCTLETVGNGKQAQWVSEAGSIDVFFFPGPTPLDVQRQMSFITGKVALPPLFSLGYHQCRWNYRSEEDVLQVDEGFDTHDIPYDVIWLDIEHTDGKRYFTWDPHNFPTPEKMQNAIAAKGRKMVTITDPHIKRASGYHVYDEATANGYFVKTSSGSDYEGHCWPGTSSWLDYTNPTVRNWYTTLFQYDRYKGSTPILYTWIDMNEPSVFNSHEVTMDKNAVHWNNVKHRDVHNMYGFYQNMATYQGLYLRSTQPPHETTTRPFLLTRSFFAGTQRYAAVWTGDNAAEWSHLEKSIPMTLALSLSSLPFVGADVGGFFGNPEEELVVRWYQTGIFYPFFRGHAHLETKRREPWLFSAPTTERIRAAIQTRYRLLPYIYTVFYRASQEGTSVISPLFFYWPTDVNTFERQDSLMLGDALLARPVLSQGVSSVDVYLPGNAGQSWYGFSGHPYAPGQHTLPVTLDSIPLFQLAGTIVPLRERSRRSTTSMRNDPFTLQVARASDGTAKGSLFLDDTHSFKYVNGAYVYRTFTLNGNKLSSSTHTDTNAYTTPVPNKSETFTTSTWVERIRIFGWPTKPTEIHLEHHSQAVQVDVDGAVDVARGLQNRKQLSFEYEGTTLVIRKPVALIAADWTITIA
eukprot:TRINITY_DN47_c0_g1_i1.p1 TRINITY_DN47_c0_g1~~TRINITY_DN47_c0_g1_i1.p1  ORF type:complete len:824 (-),score=123.57 TRINITY_DN47_c0_g1_i1:31-2502(-)